MEAPLGLLVKQNEMQWLMVIALWWSIWRTRNNYILIRSGLTSPVKLKFLRLLLTGNPTIPHGSYEVSLQTRESMGDSLGKTILS